FTSVSASWTQPTVNCAATGKKSAYSSFWVGIDGDGSSTVEQTGTDADCVRGVPHYYGWFEVYPAFPVNYTDTVRPGDAMSASVTYSSSNFTLILTDRTRGWAETQTKALASAQRFSAEVIAEAPSSGKVLPLADFGTVAFTASLANRRTIGSLNPDQITMATNSTVKAVPSKLVNGQNFTVTWQHS
ncbi:MAG: G1 family glutamic endopeptidase, partial [Marmoricola sp.]